MRIKKICFTFVVAIIFLAATLVLLGFDLTDMVGFAILFDSSHEKTVSVSEGFNLEIVPISVIMFPGEEKSLRVRVKNNEGIYANKCHLKTSDEHKGFIDSSRVTNIGIGEVVDFNFFFKPKKDFVDGFGLFVVCLDGIRKQVPFRIIMVENDLSMSISSVRIVENEKVFVEYDLEEKPLREEEIIMSVIDAKGVLLDEKLVFVSEIQGQMLFDVSKADSGVVTIIASKDGNTLTSMDVLYEKQSRGITGLAVTDATRKYSPIIIILLVLFVLSFFILRRIWGLSHQKY